MAYELDKLPTELQDRLVRAGRGEDPKECPALALEGTVGKWILTVVGLLVGLAPCLYVLDYRRMLPFDETMGCLVVHFLGMWMFTSGVGRLRRYKAARVQPVMVLGSHDLMVYEERGGLVEILPLASIERVFIRNQASARIDRRDLPSLLLIPHGNLGVFFEEMQRRRQAAIEAPLAEGAPGNWHSAAENSGAKPGVDWKAPSRGALHLRVLATGALAAFVVFFAAWRHVAMRVAVDRFEYAQEEDTIQSWKSWLKLALRSSEVLAPAEKFPLSVKGKWPYGRDHTHPVLATTPFVENLEKGLARYDQLCWAEAEAAGTAGALRGYLEDFPAPAQEDAAVAALRDLYRDAEERYLAGAAGVPEPAREGMKDLLRVLATDHFESEKVGVSFLPVKGVEGGAIETLVKANTGAKVVHPVGPSFTQKANEGRHSKIVGSLNRGIQKVVGDLFELEERPLDAPGPRILVGYEVKFSGNHFFSKSQASLPMAERELYVGIVVLFTCSIQTPAPGEVASQDPKEGHPVHIQASPAMDFRVRGSRYSSMERMVYDRMAETAFDEFSTKVAETYGIGALSRSSASPTKAP